MITMMVVVVVVVMMRMTMMIMTTTMMIVPFYVCLPNNCKQQFLALSVSVSPSIWNNSAPTQQSAMKFYTGDFY
jgi:hypothetical protein